MINEKELLVRLLTLLRDFNAAKDQLATALGADGCEFLEPELEGLTRLIAEASGAQAKQDELVAKGAAQVGWCASEAIDDAISEASSGEQDPQEVATFLIRFAEGGEYDVREMNEENTQLLETHGPLPPREKMQDERPALRDD